MAREKIAPIQNQYIHLAGTTHDRPAGVPRLYLGPNHLLIMQLKSQRETARRFYYSDITALLLGVLLAFVFDALDRTVKAPQDIETHLGLPLLVPVHRSLDRRAPYVGEPALGPRRVSVRANIRRARAEGHAGTYLASRDAQTFLIIVSPVPRNPHRLGQIE